MKAIQHNISQTVAQNRNNSKISHVKHNTSAKVTPLDFDNFVPWFCLQFQVPITVVVKRMKQENYMPHRVKRTSSAKSKIKIEHLDFTDSTKSSLPNSITTTKIKQAIPITAYYNSQDQLVEIAFIDAPHEIDRKIIYAINLCLPFHKSLYRLKLGKRGVTKMVLYEISNLLPHSNITDICLDDIYLSEGNYYSLLGKPNGIHNLSLRRCHINDEVCKGIVNTMQFGLPAFNTLLTLDLASNGITDIGAEYIGCMLRQNRTLLYLNISDNNITDTGANYILNHLLIFPLTRDEKIARNHRQLEYFIKRIEAYRKCEDEFIGRIKQEEDKENQIDLGRFTNLKCEGRIIKRNTMCCFEEPTIAEQAEKITSEIVGEFKDIWNNNIIHENGQIYSIGNLRLSYLNLAYNNLGYYSIRKLYNVLKYQSNLSKPKNCTGLLKIVLDGNNTPKMCEELQAIESFLETAIIENIPFETAKCKSPVKSTKKYNHKTCKSHSR